MHALYFHIDHIPIQLLLKYAPTFCNTLLVAMSCGKSITSSQHYFKYLLSGVSVSAIFLTVGDLIKLVWNYLGFALDLDLACGGRLICGRMLFMVTTIGLLLLWCSSQVKPGESEKRKLGPNVWILVDDSCAYGPLTLFLLIHM